MVAAIASDASAGPAGEVSGRVINMAAVLWPWEWADPKRVSPRDGSDRIAPDSSVRVNVYFGRAGALLSASVNAGLLRSRVWIALREPSRSPRTGSERWPESDGPHVRDALDSAVRALAVSPGPIADRLEMAGSILSGALSRADFLEDEDLAVFDRILLGFIELDLIDENRDAAADEVQRALAGDIVDLRDGLAGRALYDLRVSAGRPAPPLA